MQSILFSILHRLISHLCCWICQQRQKGGGERKTAASLPVWLVSSWHSNSVSAVLTAPTAVVVELSSGATSMNLASWPARYWCRVRDITVNLHWTLLKTTFLEIKHENHLNNFIDYKSFVFFQVRRCEVYWFVLYSMFSIVGDLSVCSCWTKTVTTFSFMINSEKYKEGGAFCLSLQLGTRKVVDLSDNFIRVDDDANHGANLIHILLVNLRSSCGTDTI